MNLHQLKPDHFARVEPLFGDHLNHHLFGAGILAGKYPGTVVVDNVDHPQAALVIKDGMWCYLGGTPDHNSFLPALRTALAEKQFIGEGTGGLFISTSSGAWRDALDTLVADRPPIEMPRRLYLAESGQTFDQFSLLAGFTLHAIDEALPADIDGDLPGDVQKVLELRASGDEPDQMAFGCVALHERTCAAHAMIDCIVGERGEIGLATEPSFRRQGLALATSAATIAHGLKRGLTAVHWDCATFNTGSVRTAERLGLRLVAEHSLYLIVFDQVGHLINWAWSHLDAAQYPAALDVSQRLVALDGGMGYGHFLVGAAWAGMGNADRAISAFNTAVDHGWDDLAGATSLPPVQALRDMPEWHALAARIATKSAQPEQ